MRQEDSRMMGAIEALKAQLRFSDPGTKKKEQC